jgi:two-component system, NarL family, invasion response regulator UvrY
VKQTTPKIKVALADDHVLLRNALANLIDTFDECKVIHQSSNGRELTEYFNNGHIADVVILDLNMPVMDGFETADWLLQHFPEVNVLMLTMYDTDLALIKLLKAGVKGFLKKDVHPSELKFAIQSVMQSGYYYSNQTTGKLMNLFRVGPDNEMALQRKVLNEQEQLFLKLSCSDLTYKEIAMTMGLSPRSVDNLRDMLFNKVKVKSRVGLAMYAMKNGIERF